MTEAPTLEVIGVSPPSAIEAINRAEVDIQISTAQKYPRSIQKFISRARDLVSLDEETAGSCIYRRPVGRSGGEMKYAEGMSIRMAEIVASCYGNLRYGSQLVEDTERRVVARGVAHDIESNVMAHVEVVESTVKSDGRPYDERMRVVVAKAALSKAARDAVFKVVPRALCKTLEDAARAVALGQSVAIETRRERAMDWATKLGVSKERVFSALGVKGEADLTDDHLTTMLGLRTSLKEGDITVEEAFPHLQDAGKMAAAIGKKKEES